MHPGQDDSPGEEGGGRGDQVLALIDQVAGDLGAAVGGFAVAVEFRVVVGAQLDLGAACEQHLLGLAGHQRTQAGRQPVHGDAEERAHTGGPGEQSDGGPRLKEPVVDVTVTQQGGEGTGDSDQAQGLHHAGDQLAQEKADGRPSVDAPGQGQRAAHQLGQAAGHVAHPDRASGRFAAAGHVDEAHLLPGWNGVAWRCSGRGGGRPRGGARSWNAVG